MKTHNMLKQLMLLLLMFLPFSSCDKFSDDFPTDYTESPKELDGTWKIIKASRNGSDITSQFDFTQFRLNFNSDKTYTIENYLPFLVKSNGTWSLDDPQYPFNLVFRENGSENALISGLSYPIVNGKRQINLSFSPGCHSNIYTYVFEKVTN